MHTGHKYSQFWSLSDVFADSAGHKLHQQLVEPIRIIRPDLETTVQSQIHRSINRAGPPVVYKRPQVSQRSFHTSLVPYQTPRCNLCLNTGVSNMVYHPGHFSPGEHMHTWCDGGNRFSWVECWVLVDHRFCFLDDKYILCPKLNIVDCMFLLFQLFAGTSRLPWLQVSVVFARLVNLNQYSFGTRPHSWLYFYEKNFTQMELFHNY